MKVYVLTEIDVKHVGHSPNTILIFPTHGAAVAEMARMYSAALKQFDTTEDDPKNVFDASGFAYIGDSDYRLDIYECVLDTGFSKLNTLQELTVMAEQTEIRAELMHDKNMSRDEVWELVQKWAEEFDESHEDFDYANTSFYDEVDRFLAQKYSEYTTRYELVTDPMDTEFVLAGKELFGVDDEVYVKFHVCDGYATADGIRMEYPKVADLTPAQIAEMDEYLGGRINDSGCVCPEDVALWCGKIVSVTGIMDTGQNHDADLVRRINVAWVEDKYKFRPILCALYERDIDEITDHDAFKIPAWEEWKEYNDGLRSGDWDAYNDRAFAEMQTNWADYAENYLMHIADGQDLKCILDFVRG